MRETHFLVHMAGSWVERVDLQLDPVQTDRLERVGEHKRGGLGAEPTAEVSGAYKEDPKSA